MAYHSHYLYTHLYPKGLIFDFFGNKSRPSDVIISTVLPQKEQIIMKNEHKKAFQKCLQA